VTEAQFETLASSYFLGFEVDYDYSNTIVIWLTHPVPAAKVSAFEAVAEAKLGGVRVVVVQPGEELPSDVRRPARMLTKEEAALLATRAHRGVDLVCYYCGVKQTHDPSCPLIEVAREMRESPPPARPDDTPLAAKRTYSVEDVKVTFKGQELKGDFNPGDFKLELTRRVQERLGELLKRNPKIPYTAAGVEVIRSELRKVLEVDPDSIQVNPVGDGRVEVVAPFVWSELVLA